MRRFFSLALVPIALSACHSRSAEGERDCDPTCSGQTPVCDLATRTCVTCTSALGCETGEVCDTSVAGGRCVTCTTTLGCGAGQVCDTRIAGGRCVASPILPLCDDGDSCTSDRLDESGGCLFEILPDGTPCNDADVCTSRDRCVSGKCVGEPLASTPQVRSELRSFGEEPDLKTLINFVTDDHLVFASKKTLALVAIEGDTLRLLDRVDMSGATLSEVIGASIWVMRPRTFVLPVGNARFAFVNVHTGIDLYDISLDRIIPLGSYQLDPVDPYATAATGGDGRIWKCSANGIQSFTVDAVTAMIEPGPELSLPEICQGISLSPDGNTLLVAMGSDAVTGGLALVDVASDGTMSLRTTVLDDKYLLDVTMAGGYIAIYQLRDQWSGLGDVLVLDAGTLTEVASFPMTQTADASPVGIAMTDDGLILERELEGGLCNTYSHTAELYELTPAGATLRSDWSVVGAAGACNNVKANVPLHMVGRGHYAILEPTHQVVRIASQTGVMIPLSGPQQGSFERVLPAGEDLVEVHGPTNAQLLDISQPDNPTMQKGGLYAPMDVPLLKLELSDRAPAVLLPTPLQIPPVGPLTTLLLTRERELPTIVGSIANDDADDGWASAGNYLYQWAAQGTMDFRIQRFPLFSVTRTEGQSVASDIDQVLTTDPPAELSHRELGSYLQVDALTGDLIFMEPRSDGGGSGSIVPTWFTLGQNGYQPGPVLPGLPAGYLGDVALHGGRSLVVTPNQALILTRAGTTAARIDLDPNDIQLGHVLGFNERLVYLSARLSGSATLNAVVVFRADDLSEVARYRARSPVYSVAEVGNNLVFGMRTAIAVASPACP